jgi:hypothetical protein
MTSQGFMPARNAGLSSHRPGKLNNLKWPLSKFSQATTAKTSDSSRASSLVTSLCVRSIETTENLQRGPENLQQYRKLVVTF